MCKNKGGVVKKYIVLLMLCSLVSAQVPADTLNWLLYENKQIKLNLENAGKNLNNAELSFFIGLALNIVGSTIITMNAISDESSDALIITGIGINFVALVTHVLAWRQIGSAGDKLKLKD